jgi:hypothetical protein
MASPHIRDTILELERDVVGCLLHGRSDPRLVWWQHFPHQRHRSIAMTCTILRQQGILFTDQPGDDARACEMAAEANAELVALYIERCGLWPSLACVRHELVVECLERVGVTLLACFHDAVARLVAEVEWRNEYLALRRRCAEMEAQRRQKGIAAVAEAACHRTQEGRAR